MKSKHLEDYIEYIKYLEEYQRDVEKKLKKIFGFGVEFDKVPEPLIKLEGGKEDEKI